MDVHIDDMYNIELFDQLVGRFYDRPVMSMLQMLIAFFHPIFSYQKKLKIYNQNFVCDMNRKVSDRYRKSYRVSAFGLL